MARRYIRAVPERFLSVAIQIIPDESPVDPGIENWSGFVQFAHILNVGRIIGNAEADLYAKSKQGELWADLKPKNGSYDFELATELPFYLPTIQSKNEYLITVGKSELFVCLRMVRAFIGKGMPQEDGLRYFLVHRLLLPQLAAQRDCAGIHPLLIKTFVSRRFSCEAASAQNAIQENFLTWRDELVGQIVHLVDATRTASPEAAKFLLPQQSLAFFPVFWLRAAGDEDKTRCEQFFGGHELGTFRPQVDLKADTVGRLNGFLQTPETIPSDEHELGMARTFCNFGYLKLAVVQVCLACEIALSQKYWGFLQGRGVSKKKLDDNKKEITFSQLLNIHLFTMCDVPSLAGSEKILAAVNWARKVRNDVVHEGKTDEEFTTQRVLEAIDAAERLLAFLHIENPPPIAATR